jgi:hypothetical protein
MQLRRRKKIDERGQVIVEFLIVSTMILTLIFMFVQIAWGIAYGHYAQYATYMASRAYLAATFTQAEQAERAGKVLKDMLKNGGGQDRMPFIAKARGGDERDAQGAEPVDGAMVGTHPEAVGKDMSRIYSWAEGVQYNFGVNVFLLPLSSAIKNEGMGETIKGGSGDQETKGVQWKGAIPFTSDSFLGREPTVDECYRWISRLSRSTGISRGDGADFLEDNGC